MSDTSISPDFATLDVAMDVWSEPFWNGTANHHLLMPRCEQCGTFRWPAGPFCHVCRTSRVEWVSPGQPRIYSFTILPVPGPDRAAPPAIRIPALVEFDDAPGVRLVSVLVDAAVEEVAIGVTVAVGWTPAANAVVPIFRLASSTP